MGKLNDIDTLQDEIENYGKLPEEILKKINYKFRLEWNYTSNSMEGNTLTIEETRSVMVGNITVEGKPLKDVLEMKGHDEVITNILRIGKGELNISEGRIRDIHKGIMYEDDPAKKEKIGKWKLQNNYIINYKGERNDFTPPADVPDSMHKLVNWLNSEKEKIERNTNDALHPAFIAFKFHLEYISIHPFYDGNGRTARILMNLILISYGLPPVYIKANEKNSYYQYLADIQGYGGDPNLFYEFMMGLLIRSLQLITSAIDGNEIEEPDDIQKDLEILRRKIGHDAIITKAPKLIYDLFLQVSKSIIPKFNLTLTRFDSFFSDSKDFKYVNRIDETYEKRRVNTLDPFGQFEMRTIGKTKIWGHDVYEDDITIIQWRTVKFGLKNAKKNIDFEVDLILQFYTENYSISIKIDTTTICLFEKKYDEQINDNLADDISNTLGKSILAKIKEILDEK